MPKTRRTAAGASAHHQGLGVEGPRPGDAAEETPGQRSPWGLNTITVPRETPEPDTLILFGTGLALVAIAAGARRLRRP